jgi:tRNA uridine 5-carboxymethylaminomethyl modification enzyme
MHIGSNKNEGGRLGDFSAKTLSASFLEAGIELQRLKTGTPPRLLGRSLDFSQMKEQRGDDRPSFFAFHDTRKDPDLFHVEQKFQRRIGWAPGCEQVSCWMTYTTESSARIVRDNLHRSAMYGGEIEGVGPRYCPSFEDKIVRFADKPRHLLFLEPEGRGTDEFYVNGLSTSLPFDVQVELVRSVPGLENAVILRPAYAVEYDFAPPTQLFPSLESKMVKGLFFAGQINGTSGYEEAAAQGLVAGVNAVNHVRELEPLVIGRHEGYIGVLIDDLVTKGTREPYRMFTSRAEYRLLFNHGSAELRLAHHSLKHRLIDASRSDRIENKRREILRWIATLESAKSPEGTWGTRVRQGIREGLPDEFERLPTETKEEVIYQVAYKGYIDRERRHVLKLGHLESLKIPDSLDYSTISGLRHESVAKLSQIRPRTLGQASRISGVNPADVSILMIKIEAGRGAIPRNPAT